MNKKIILDKTGEKWVATLTEYDPLPFHKRPENTIDEVESDSFGGIIKEIGSKNWIDELNKNF